MTVSCAGGNAGGQPSYRDVEPSSWSTADVVGFVRDAAPGHPCCDFFKHTSGFVLSSLSLEDITRQARDPDAAVSIHSALQRFQAGHVSTEAKQPCDWMFTTGESRGVCSARPELLRLGATSPKENAPQREITLFIKTPLGVAVELHVQSSSTVAEVKAQLYHQESTPTHEQRLMWNGTALLDERKLEAYGVGHGASLLLVPRVSMPAVGPGHHARRGLLMVPGGKAWQPHQPEAPHLQVVCPSRLRHFAMTLDFNSDHDLRAFTSAARCRMPTPIVEIVQKCRGKAPVRSSAHMDSSSDAVRLETVGDMLVPNTRYEAIIYLDGRIEGGTGQLRATFVAGGRIS